MLESQPRQKHVLGKNYAVMGSATYLDLIYDSYIYSLLQVGHLDGARSMAGKGNLFALLTCSKCMHSCQVMSGKRAT
jgi:hypothetical protein